MKTKLITLILILFASITHGQESNKKVYYGKVKVLMEKVEFKNLKSGKDYVGLLLLTNISRRKMEVTEIVNDGDRVETVNKSSILYPNKNFPIEVIIKKAPTGKLSNKIFIHIKGQKEPIVVDVVGNFV